MMDCSDIAVRLFDYAMDDLPAAERTAVDAHLADCRDCARLVSDYQAVSDMVHDALVTELSPETQAELDAMVLDAVKRGA